MWKLIKAIAIAAAIAMVLPECASAVTSIPKVEVVADVRQTLRDEEALTAQQTAAWWTRFAALTSAISLFVSAGGLYLIWQQLRHSSATAAGSARAAEAAADAATAAMLSSRPWLRLHFQPSAQVYTGSSRSACLEVHMENVGSTPAVGANLQAFLITDLRQPVIDDLVAAFERQSPKFGSTIFPEEHSLAVGLNVDLPAESEGPWNVLLLTGYRISGSAHRRVTGRLVNLFMNHEEAPSPFGEGDLMWQATGYELPTFRVDAT